MNLTILCLQANDSDSERITYTIVSGNTADNVFRLGRYNGVLTLNRPLRKSDGRMFNLTVMATDDGVDPLSDQANIIIELLVSFYSFAE